MEKKQTKGLKRNTIDKYYTKEAVVETCLSLIKKHLNIEKNDLCIEPSAGNGSFISSIKLEFTNYIFYDLEPENTEIIKQDYLQGSYDALNSKFNNIHIIGNPPFGRQSSLAIKFIKNHVSFVIVYHLYYQKVLKKIV